MDIYSIVIFVLVLFMIASLCILYKTQKRLKEIDGFRGIKESGDHSDEGVIDTFGK